jgi:hypothetical protein
MLIDFRKIGVIKINYESIVRSFLYDPMYSNKSIYVKHCSNLFKKKLQTFSKQSILKGSKIGNTVH